jgi:hypothetical protein
VNKVRGFDLFSTATVTVVAAAATGGVAGSVNTPIIRIGGAGCKGKFLQKPDKISASDMGVFISYLEDCMVTNTVFVIL